MNSTYTVLFNILNVAKLGLWMDILSYGNTLNRIHVCTVKPYVLKVKNSVISGTVRTGSRNTVFTILSDFFHYLV